MVSVKPRYPGSNISTSIPCSLHACTFPSHTLSEFNGISSGNSLYTIMDTITKVVVRRGTRPDIPDGQEEFGGIFLDRRTNLESEDKGEKSIALPLLKRVFHGWWRMPVHDALPHMASDFAFFTKHALCGSCWRFQPTYYFPNFPSPKRPKAPKHLECVERGRFLVRQTGEYRSFRRRCLATKCFQGR